MSIRRAPRDYPPLTDAAALTALWTELMGDEPYRFRSLWLLFIDADRRPAGPIVTVDELPDGPYDIPASDLVTLCGSVLEGPGSGGPGGGGSVAMLLTRPGAGRWTVSDRAWGRFLNGAAAGIGDVRWPVHWAHRRTLEIVQLARARESA
jgi:hypothetical protein